MQPHLSQPLKCTMTKFTFFLKTKLSHFQNNAANMNLVLADLTGHSVLLVQLPQRAQYLY